MKLIKLNDICNFEKGSTGLAKAIPGKYPLVTTGKGRKTCESYQFETSAVCIPLVSSTGHGHASLKYVHFQEGRFALGTILVALTAKNEEVLNIQFLHLYLFQLKNQILVPLMSGAANVSLSIKKIKNIEIPLPSIERQIEIVRNFNSIEIEDNDLKIELTHQQSLLKKLRQQILQEAIEGKLTKDWRTENPNVEPASELLKRIKAEKEQLIKDKKIKKQKPLPPIFEDEKPFKLPDGWAWCRLGEMITMIYGSGLTKAQCIEGGSFPVYGSNGIVGYYDSFLTEKRVIIIGRKGSAGALNVCELPSWTTDVAYYVEENKYLNFKYLFYFLQSLKLSKIGKGIKPGVNRNEAYNLIVSLSPISEQKAIVEKVENLFAICDKLEKEINENKIYSEQLMQAVLREAFEGSASD